MAFVHLHNHTVYSMLDGATRIGDMVKRAVDLGMPAVAITDHGYMYGVPELGLACDAINHGTPEYKVWSKDKSFLEKGRRDELECPDSEKDPRGYEQHMKDLAMWDAQGNIDELKPPLVIKPIFGCEVYFTPDETLARDRKPELYHMVLFAQNETGYVNLMQTVSEAAVQGFYYKPRVTLDNLRRHREGLIASSACIAGIIPKCIDRGEMDKAIEWAETFRDTFEPGNFYIEIQEHGITTDSGITDEELSKTLIEIARQVGVKVIATNDFHYLTRDDAPVQDVVMCIGTNSKIDDPNRIRMEGSEFYMKTEEEMRDCREMQRRARLGQHHPAELPAARPRRDAREPVPPRVRGGPGKALWRRLGRQGDQRRLHPRALRVRIQGHLRERLRRLLSHRGRIRALGKAKRHRRGSGPWLGSRRARRLRHGHHHLRPAIERPHVREVPLSRTYRDARYRYGLRR